jgi:hypothetical protein
MSESLTTIRSRRIVDLPSVTKLFGGEFDESFPVLSQGSTKKATMKQVLDLTKEQDYATWVYDHSGRTVNSYTWVQNNSARESQATSWVQSRSANTDSAVNNVLLSSANWSSTYNFLASSILQGELGTIALGINAVSTINILDRAITPQKLSLGAPWWDNLTNSIYFTSINDFFVSPQGSNNLNLYLSTGNASSNSNIRYPGTGTLRLSAGVGNIEIVTRSTGDLAFKTNDNNRITINGEEPGKITFFSPTEFGIGATLTVQTLSVKNLNLQEGGIFNFQTTTLSTIRIEPNSTLIFNNNNGNTAFALSANPNGSGFGIFYGQPPVPGIFLDSDGLVGIGTDDPKHKLDVFGDARMVELILKRKANSPHDEINQTTDFRGASILMARSFDNKDTYQLTVEGIGLNHNFIIRDLKNGNADRVTINNLGNVGIGTSPNNTYRVNVNGSLNTSSFIDCGGQVTIPNNTSYNIKDVSNNNVDILKFNPSNETTLKGNTINFNNMSNTLVATINSTGTFTANGDVVAFSDISLKKDITKIENALQKVEKLNGVEFTRIETEKKNIGLIAQEVEKIIPEVVHETNGIKSVAYGNLVGLLIEAVKELSEEIKELKKIKNV